jgi:predicted pyridoxine 5'-phosphate oxidase superfamily flavin-nucleotide-binding protein
LARTPRAAPTGPLSRGPVRHDNKPNKKEKFTMIAETLKQIMTKDGVVALATLGPDGPHMVNTWNTYLRISQDERLFIPAGYMHKTEANIAHNPNVLITLGSRAVEGLHGMGAGFLIKGKARFVTSGPDFDFMKEKFSWLRATLAVTIESATQTW